MDQAAYQYWWELHARIARGQPLSQEERALYDAGRRDLEQDEPLHEVLSAREAREQLHALEAERGHLEQRRQPLEAEIAALEKRLPQKTRQLLGVEE